MRSPVNRPIITIESAPEIIKIADRALKAAGAKGKLPTPIEELIQAANIGDKDTEGVITRFVSSLNEGGKLLFRSTLQKLRGIADLRQRAIYVPSDTAPRERFAKGHELGHQLIPWHHVGAESVSSFYHDTDFTLSPFVNDIFDIEANFFASEVIFQGKLFTHRARDYKPSFEAVFLLADLHGASRQATMRRFVEVQDEVLACVSYLPSLYERRDGLPILRAPRLIGSPGFNRKYKQVGLPTQIPTDHPWSLARANKNVSLGEIYLYCDGSLVRFEWQGWWNSYALLVLLRRRPSLGRISRLLAVR